MKVIALANAKGGVGKTTISAHVAWYFSGWLRVLAIDVDPQRNLSHMLAESAAPITALDLFKREVEIPPSPPLTLIPATKRLDDEVDRSPDDAITFVRNLNAAARHFDVCVIDTPPSLRNVRTSVALYVADYVVAPIGMADFSLIGVSDLQDYILREVPESTGGEPPTFIGFVPSIYHRSSPAERERYEFLRANYAGRTLAEIIPKRDAFSRSATERLPVWRLPGESAREAAKEMRALMERIATEMDLVREGEGAA